MNYFEDHIGDYAAATAHLSWDEDMAYTRLIRAYYHAEKPIPQGQAYRLARASTPAQRRAVDVVLSEFFTLGEGGHHQKRCDEEIARFKDKQAKAKRSAEARWSAQPAHTERNANASAIDMRTHSEGNAHQTPDTRHQTPKKKEEKDQGSLVFAAADAAPAKAVRGSKKCPASFFVTPALFDWADEKHPLVDLELETAKFRDHTFSKPIIDWDGAWRNWIRGAKTPQFDRRQSPPAKSFAERDAEAKAARVYEMTGGLMGGKAAPEFDFIDMEEGNGRLLG